MNDRLSLADSAEVGCKSLIVLLCNTPALRLKESWSPEFYAVDAFRFSPAGSPVRICYADSNFPACRILRDVPHVGDGVGSNIASNAAADSIAYSDALALRRNLAVPAVPEENLRPSPSVNFSGKDFITL